MTGTRYARSITWAVAIVLAVSLLPISAAASRAARDQVRTSPVVALGVRGSVAAYALEISCDLHVWSLPTGRVTSFDAALDCSSNPTFAHVAIASGEVVWSELEEHNRLYGAIRVVRTSKPGRVRTIYSEMDADIGALAADDRVVAFSTQEGPDYGGPRATLWVGTTSRAAAIAEAAGWMDRIAVEGDIVALGYRDGRVRLFHTSGRRIRAFRAGTAVHGLALDEGALLTLAGGRVSVRTLGGRTVLSRPLRGRGAPAELMDANDGLVVYRSGSTLWLLRLADGRDVLVQTPKTPVEYLHAEFGAPGLVVAHLAKPSKPSGGGIVRLISRRELDQLLARGS